MSNKEYRIAADYQNHQALVVEPTEVNGSLIVLIVNNNEDNDERFGTTVTTIVSATYDAAGEIILNDMDVINASEVWANTNDVDINDYAWQSEDIAGVSAAIKKYLMQQIIEQGRS